MEVFWIEILCIVQLNGQKENKLVQPKDSTFRLDIKILDI